MKLAILVPLDSVTPRDKAATPLEEAPQPAPFLTALRPLVGFVAPLPSFPPTCFVRDLSIASIEILRDYIEYFRNTAFREHCYLLNRYDGYRTPAFQGRLGDLRLVVFAA